MWGHGTVGTALSLAAALMVSSCAAGPATTDAPRPIPGAPSSTEAPAPAPDPQTPLSWGPTVAELERARALVADWTPERLAGQVVVGRYLGTDPGELGRMVSELHLAGVAVTSGNVVDAAQVRAMTRAVSAAVAADGRDFPAVIGVDQEGGYVSHLRGVATDFPAFAAAGAAIEANGRTGRAVVRQAAAATGMELRDYGFTWVFAPVADVTIGAADPTIGSRSPSGDPAVAAKATAAAVRGYGDAAVVSTVKHFPGHGAATSDSHDTLPVLDSTLAELGEHDLPPFAAAVASRAPAVMMSHLDLTAVAPGVPATLAPQAYALLREELGFEGVAITDSLGMGAVAGRPKPAVAALNAGADLLLMPVDTRVTHGILTEAIASGEVSRARAEEAAARVVAVQLWQQRMADGAPVPEDSAAQAEQAAAALADAGS